MTAKQSKKANQLSRAVIKTVAGMTLTKPQDFLRLAAHAGDEVLKGDWSRAIADTYAYFINKGEIDPAYFDTTKFADLAPEFQNVERGAFGVDKLNHLRRIFVNLALDTEAGSHKKYLLDIALEMTEPEIKVLIADYHLGKKNVEQEAANKLRHSFNWRIAVVEESGLKHEALVDRSDQQLISKGLLSAHLMTDQSGTDFKPRTGRTTTMGAELCDLMFLDDDPFVN